MPLTRGLRGVYLSLLPIRRSERIPLHEPVPPELYKSLKQPLLKSLAASSKRLLLLRVPFIIFALRPSYTLSCWIIEHKGLYSRDT